MQESGYKMTKTENRQLIFVAKCVHNFESTLKEYSILKKIGLLDQPITTRPAQLIIHYYKSVGKTYVEKRSWSAIKRKWFG